MGSIYEKSPAPLRAACRPRPAARAPTAAHQLGRAPTGQDMCHFKYNLLGECIGIDDTGKFDAAAVATNAAAPPKAGDVVAKTIRCALSSAALFDFDSATASPLRAAALSGGRG